MHLRSLEEIPKIVEKVRKNYEAQYLGQPKEVLLKDFGKPNFIKPNVFTSGETYDEEWHYSKGGWLDGETGDDVWFYLKDGKVAAVSVW